MSPEIEQSYRTTGHLPSVANLSRENNDLRARLAEAERLLRALLDEYAKEQDEHGFPFNFALRDAHRAASAYLASQGETE